MKCLYSILMLFCWGAISGQGSPGIYQTLSTQIIPHYYHLHKNPELSLQEEKTSSYLREQLAKLGYEISNSYGGYGFAASHKNGNGPVLWVRADMDGLPVEESTGVDYASTRTGLLDDGTTVPVMHACGHDVHMSCWLGTATFLMKNRHLWKGTVVFLAQPAEEFGDGARKMIEDGLFEQLPVPNYVLALHVSATLQAGTIGYVPGYSYANVDAMNILVHGTGGHGAYPHTTIDPVVLASRIIVGLQTLVSRNFSPLEPLVITVGSIEGGSKGNIIPDQVKLQLTIRYHNERLRPEIISAIRRLTTGIASSAGLPETKYPELEYFPENLPGVYNHPGLTSRLAGVWTKHMGAEHVLEVPASMGGEDFGRYGTTEHEVPICIFWLGSISPDLMTSAEEKTLELPSLHSSKYLPDIQPTLATGIRAMSLAALELLQQED